SPENRTPGPSEQGDSPVVTLASEALAVPDVSNNRLQLSMRSASTYTVGKQDTNYNIDTSDADKALQAQRRAERQVSRPATEIDTIPLYKIAYKNKTEDAGRVLDARIELHQRLALPLACLLLALAGVPLGISTHRTGKSGAVVMTLVIAFAYYTSDLGLV